MPHGATKAKLLFHTKSHVLDYSNKLLLLLRMPTSLPPQTEVVVTTTIEEGKITIPFKATFTTGLKEW